ncbi:TonB family protein [candidate division KSB1 bacterium]
MTVQNIIFLSGILILLYFLRKRDVRLLRFIALIGLVKLFIPPFISISVPTENLNNPPVSYDVASSIEKGAGTIVNNLNIPVSFTSTSVWMICWISIVSVLVIFVLIKLICLRKLLHTSTPVNVDRYYRTQKDRNVIFLKSTKFHSPLVFGFLKHKIILPCNWDTIPAECKRAILAHEMAHIVQYDHWINLFQLIAQIIHFINPLAWIHGKLLKTYNEMACDDMAMKIAKMTPLQYSDHLIQIAESISIEYNNRSLIPAFMGSTKPLKNRILYQLSKNNLKPKGRLSLKNIIIITLVLFSVIPFSIYCSKVIMLDELDNQLSMDGIFTKSLYDASGIEIIPPKPVYGLEKIGPVNDFVLYINESEEAYEGEIEVLIDEKGIPVEFEFLDFSDSKNSKDLVISSLKKIEFTPAKIKGQTARHWIKLKVNQTAKNTKNETITLNSPPVIIGGLEDIQSRIKFPESIEKAGISGNVEVNVHIDNEGRPIDFKIVKSLVSVCDAAAIAAISETDFKPAVKNGYPVDSWMKIPVEFIQDEQKYDDLGSIQNVLDEHQLLISNEISVFIDNEGKINLENEQISIVDLRYMAKKITEINKDILFIISPSPKTNFPVISNIRDAIYKAGGKSFVSNKRNYLETDSIRKTPVNKSIIADKHIVNPDEILKSGPSDNIPEFLQMKDWPKIIGGERAIQKKVVYPELAKMAGIEGIVRINVLVNEKGVPEDFEVIQSLGNIGCDEAAIDAIKQVRFEPAKQRDIPVKFWVAIPIKFKLRGGIGTYK